MNRCIAWFLTACGSLATAPGHLHAAKYTLVRIPDTPGLATIPMSINDARQVGFTKARSAFGNVFYTAYVWNPQDGLRQLFPAAPSVSGYAFDINENGQVVGYWTGPATSVATFPFLWEDGVSKMIFPDVFIWPDMVRTLALNDLGQIVGTTSDTLLTDARDRYGFLWTGSADPVPLPEFRRANDINNLGQIVGQSSETRTALLREPDGSLVELGALPGDSESTAIDINESGVVVGTSGTGHTAAFLWSNGAMTAIHSGEPPTARVALAVNDSGAVVGWGTSVEGDTIGWLWEGGTLYTLNELVEGGVCTSFLPCIAHDVNNHGDIVGSAYEDGVPYEFVLIRLNASAVPGDRDADGDVDSVDVAQFIACRTGPAVGPPASDCEWADFDGDLDVDHDDFGIMQRCIAGPDQPGDPDCAN